MLVRNGLVPANAVLERLADVGHAQQTHLCVRLPSLEVHCGSILLEKVCDGGADEGLGLHFRVVAADGHKPCPGLLALGEVFEFSDSRVAHTFQHLAKSLRVVLPVDRMRV